MLLVVGGLDATVIEVNREAFALLECPKDLVIIPCATHLFEEPGTLEAVARYALQWFERYLGAQAPARSTSVSLARRSTVAPNG
jgi:hypothetical protein